MGQCSCQKCKNGKKPNGKIEKITEPEDIYSQPEEKSKTHSFISTNFTCNDHDRKSSYFSKKGDFDKKAKSAKNYLEQIGVSQTDPQQKRFYYYYEKEELPQQSDLNMQAFSQQLFPVENNFNEISTPSKFGYNKETFNYFTQPLKCTSILKYDTIKLKALSDQLMLQLFEEMDFEKRQTQSVNELQSNSN